MKAFADGELGGAPFLFPNVFSMYKVLRALSAASTLSLTGKKLRSKFKRHLSFKLYSFLEVDYFQGGKVDSGIYSSTYGSSMRSQFAGLVAIIPIMGSQRTYFLNISVFHSNSN